MSEPEYSLEKAQEVVATKVHPRVTKESIEGKIDFCRYIEDGTGTFCVIVMYNKFEVNGYSKPADPRNYDLEVGKRYAYENAFRQLWQLEGYLLCENLYNED